LISSFAANPSCEIVAIADLDSRRFGDALEIVEKAHKKSPAHDGRISQSGG
jgi:hypothetical protein